MGKSGHEIYEADVHPFGSLHDRACELYQQLVGIIRTKKAAEMNKLILAEQVYGQEHFQKDHIDTYYKPKYLK